MTALDTTRIARRIDALLAPWLDKPVPGIALGVVQDGALAVHRCAGLASVELGVPIGPQTTFRIASVSKQFTCAAILMLAQEGKLALDDKASDHLPGLPDLGVTLRHLMHNTSGIRDMLEIMRMGGADLGTPIRSEDLMAGIQRQRTLNFDPNTSYLYSNSNFLLLGRIAERVSGEPLAAFLDRRIFTPLGMSRTRLTERVSEPASGLATGYLPEAGGGYGRAPHAFPLHGEGGLVSCVEDLAAWSHHLDTAGSTLAADLAETLPFANGVENFYARGQTIRTRRSIRTVSHGGLWPGFKTEFLRAPALGVTIIAISNNGGADPNALGLQVLDLLLDGIPGTPPAPPRPSPDLAARLSGSWVAPDRSASLDAAIEEGRLTLRSNGAPATPAMTGDGWAAVLHGSVALAVRPSGEDAMEVERAAGERSIWHRARTTALPSGLGGIFASPEMATRWTLAEDAEGWCVRPSGPVVAGGPRWPITPLEGELFRVAMPGILAQAWLDVRAVIEAGRVVALLVHSGRAKNVRFDRVA